MNAKTKRGRNRHHVKGTTKVRIVDTPHAGAQAMVVKGAAPIVGMRSAGQLKHRRIGFTNVVTMLGGAATTGLAVAAALPAAPIAALAASAIGSVAAYAVSRKLDKPESD